MYMNIYIIASKNATIGLKNSNRSETTERDRVEVGGLVDRCTYRLFCGSFCSINT